MSLTKKEKPHFHVTAALVMRNDRLLISKRPEGSHLGGLWEFPGGKQEEGETLEDCIEREIMEELGIRIQAEKLLLSVIHEYHEKFITLYFFQCSLLDGEPISLDNQEIKWAGIKDLKQYRFPPPDQKIVACMTSGLFP
jgi:mutator protein MutT